MSRSGYSDDLDNLTLGRWRGRVASSIRGKRGQAMLKDLLDALDAMPEKRLIAEELVRDGDFCTLGVLGAKRGIPVAELDPYDSETVAAQFDIAEPLAQEIVYLNDEGVDDWHFVEVEICGPMRPYYPDYESHKRTVRAFNPKAAEQRWLYMREWVASNIKKESVDVVKGVES